MGQTMGFPVPSDGILAEWVKWLDWDTGLTTDDEVRQLRFLYMRFIAPAVRATSVTPPTPDRTAGLTDAMEAINNMRMAGAGNFTDPKYAGQRGCDRSDALYDAFQAVRKLLL